MPTVNLTLTGQALSKVDDTNVTLTLGGTPLTALLKATSITVGWTGQLSVARGGTGLGALGTANQLLRVNALGTALEYFTPSYGSGTVTSISVATANGLAGTSDGNAATPTLTLSTSINSPVLAGNGTALIAATTTGSGSTVVLSTSPTFVTDISAPKIISSTASGGLLLCNNNGVTVASFGVGSAGSTNIALIGATAVTGTISGTSSLTLGTASTTVGSIVLNNATNANTITIQSGVTTSSHTLTLPVANASGVLTNNGSGTLTWAAASSGITIDSTSITDGGANRILFENSANQVSESATNFYFQTATPFNHVFAAGRTGVITGVSNSIFGYEAGKVLTSGYSSTIIGYQAGVTLVTQYENTIVGSLAGSGAGTDATWARQNSILGYSAGVNMKGSQNVVIGSEAGNSEQNYNTVIGYRARFNATSTQDGNTVIGNQAGNAMNGNYNTYIGMYAGFAGTGSYSIALGYNARATGSNQLVIGYTDATAMISNVYFNGYSSTTPQSITLHAAHGSGTNIAGANITIDGGNATGNAASGFYKVTTGVKGASGTTLQTSGDRVAVIGKYVDLTAATATAFCRVNIPTSTVSGGFMLATVEANDGVDYQSRTFYVSWAAANKAGTTTVGLDVPHEIVASTSGTLTGTMTLVDSGSGNIDFKMDAVSSLVETTLRISFQVFKNLGTGAITAS